MSGEGARPNAAPGAAHSGHDAEAARERARKKARLDRIFRGEDAGRSGVGGGGFSERHYDEQRPPHHGG